ncbi:MAG: ABC transporter ATP-binding protein [Clostridium sp.]
MEVIKLSNIRKVYGEGNGRTCALDKVNLVINKGELIGIIGPSGSGKSTLLNIIGLIDVQTSGDYLLNGRSVKGMKSNELAVIRNEELGFIFQNFNLLNDYTVLDNVTMPLVYAKKNKGDKLTRGMDMLKSLGMEDHISKTPDKLSGGEKQRVAIARALINNANIILADEPTGSLDKKNGRDVIDKLKEINKSGKTVIIITHDEGIAKECDRVIKIEDGHIVSDESTRQMGP